MSPPISTVAIPTESVPTIATAKRPCVLNVPESGMGYWPLPAIRSVVSRSTMTRPATDRLVDVHSAPPWEETEQDEAPGEAGNSHHGDPPRMTDVARQCLVDETLASGAALVQPGRRGIVRRPTAKHGITRYARHAA